LLYSHTQVNYGEPGAREFVLDADGTLVATQVYYEAKLEFAQVELATMFTLDIVGTGLCVLLGPSVGFASHAKRIQTMAIEPPPGVFADSSIFEPDTVLSDNLDDRPAVRLALLFGAQYEFHFGPLYLVPGIYYNYDLTGASPSANLRINSYLVGLDVRFELW
jgi:hypothetical protein